MLEKAWWREYEAAGHILPAIRKQPDIETQFTFSFWFSLGIPGYPMDPSYLR